MIKELIINGKLYAKYEIDENVVNGDIVFVNIAKERLQNKTLDDATMAEYEDFLISIISMIEGRKFQGAGYLNLDADG
jgi:hypothetical protein